MLEIPKPLQSLVDTGRWPLNADDCGKQDERNWVDAETVKQVADDEERIYFYPPPFLTIAASFSVRGQTEIWKSDLSAPNEIHFDRAIIIGDFGIGSDSPIILDYQDSLINPPVKRLKWGPGPKCVNHWEKIAESFQEFSDILNLPEMAKHAR